MYCVLCTEMGAINDGLVGFILIALRNMFHLRSQGRSRIAGRWDVQGAMVQQVHVVYRVVTLECWHVNDNV